MDSASSNLAHHSSCRTSGDVLSLDGKLSAPSMPPQLSTGRRRSSMSNRASIDSARPSTPPQRKRPSIEPTEGPPMQQGGVRNGTPRSALRQRTRPQAVSIHFIDEESSMLGTLTNPELDKTTKGKRSLRFGSIEKLSPRTTVPQDLDFSCTSFCVSSEATDAQTASPTTASCRSHARRTSCVSSLRSLDFADMDIDDNAADVLEDSTSESDIELSSPQDVPETVLRRRLGVAAEAHGAFNLRHADFRPPSVPKSAQVCHEISEALKGCPLFYNLEDTILGRLADTMEIESFKHGQCIFQQGDIGRSGYLLLEGCVDICVDDMDEGADNLFTRRDSTGAAPNRGRLLTTVHKGRFFGEITMLWGVRRTKSAYANGPSMTAKLKRDCYTALVTRGQMLARTKREEILRRVEVFETLSQEHISLIADALDRKTFEKGDKIVRQGEPGKEFYVVLTGECVAEGETGSRAETSDVQEYGRYGPGDLFGERALLHKTLRAATVTATTKVEVLCLKRSKFERMLGPLHMLQHRNYLSDPRKSIADFYKVGDRRGPRGCLGGRPPNPCQLTQWFAVYRPTSRDAIAKMLSGKAVGKGLNVKGKSAKKNHLAGFVPYLQISKQEHKKMIEPSKPENRLNIYYATEIARDVAIATMEPWLTKLPISDPVAIIPVNSYTGLYGLDLPECVMRQAYIIEQDISQKAGWETGRQSLPDFMDMNMHAACGHSKPEVVLYQMDTESPMNPHGLLVAYAEATVKPVVSDFDTFTVGSRGMTYEPLPDEQQDLALWALNRTEEILRKPSRASWLSRWLAVLREANAQGFHPVSPEYGWGDATSYRLTKAVVEATIESGAVRHGAECFNFHHPQELDEDYLVVWDGFEDIPWRYMAQGDLRDFLHERIDDGYCFPLNPVWIVRDPEWHDIYEALLENEETKAVCNAWYSPGSKIREKIEAMYAEFPHCFDQTDGLIEGFELEENRMSVVSDIDATERADLLLRRAQVISLSAIKMLRCSKAARNSTASMASQVTERDLPEDEIKAAWSDPNDLAAMTSGRSMATSLSNGDRRSTRHSF